MAEPLAVGVAGAAELLGVSPGLIRKLTLDGEIPFVKLGRPGGSARVVYPVADLERWLRERTQQPGSIALRLLDDKGGGG
ncbi:MAG: helix-turn-helix domain-containing protein [Candidatus Dormibacterales bacterium]